MKLCNNQIESYLVDATMIIRRSTNIFRISGGDIASLCTQVIRHKFCQYFDVVIYAQSRQMLKKHLRMCGKYQHPGMNRTMLATRNFLPRFIINTLPDNLNLFMRTVNVLARLCKCAGSPEHLLFTRTPYLRDQNFSSHSQFHFFLFLLIFIE